MPKKTHVPFPQLIVRLPRVKAPSAVTLGNGIRHAAETLEDLPPSLVRALALMTMTHKSLVKVWTARLAAKKKNKRLQTIMRHERNAVRALYRYLLQLSRMVSEFDEESPAKAQAVLDALFPQGMTFTTQTHPEVSGEMDRRLETMTKDGWRPRILELGGGPMLRVVEKTHRAYLAELGGKSAKVHEENLRELMEAFLKRVRLLVVHTHAWLDDCPDRAEDAHMLLRTIETIGQMKQGASMNSGPSLAKTLNEAAARTEALASKLTDEPSPPAVELDSKTPPNQSAGENAPPSKDNVQKTETASMKENGPPDPDECTAEDQKEPALEPKATVDPSTEPPEPSTTASPPYGLKWLAKAEAFLEKTKSEAGNNLDAVDAKPKNESESLDE